MLFLTLFTTMSSSRFIIREDTPALHIMYIQSR